MACALGRRIAQGLGFNTAQEPLEKHRTSRGTLGRIGAAFRLSCGPDAAKPTKAGQFIAAHPSVLKSFASATTPTSFAREAYNGIDAFILVDAAGKRQPFHFQFVPVAGAEHMDPADAAKQPPNFLVDKLPQRLAKEPVAFRMMAQLANLGDQTKDPTEPWPADRRMADLGTITITKAAADGKIADRTVVGQFG